MWKVYLFDRAVSFLHYLKERGDDFITKTSVNSAWKFNQEYNINITLGQINKAFKWVIAGLIVFLLFYTISAFVGLGIQKSKKIDIDSVAISGRSDDFTKQIIAMNSLNHYVDVISARDIFVSLKNEKYNEFQQVKDLKIEISKILTVVGIIKDNDSKVIIEGKRDKETHFLSEGERFDNVYIERIDAQNITVEYQGTKIELSP